MKLSLLLIPLILFPAPTHAMLRSAMRPLTQSRTHSATRLLPGARTLSLTKRSFYGDGGRPTPREDEDTTSLTPRELEKIDTIMDGHGDWYSKSESLKLTTLILAKPENRTRIRRNAYESPYKQDVPDEEKAKKYSAPLSIALTLANIKEQLDTITKKQEETLENQRKFELRIDDLLEIKPVLITSPEFRASERKPGT